MLDKPVDEIVYDANGKVCGVRSGDEVIKKFFHRIILIKALTFLIVIHCKDCRDKTSYW
jgi:hypothetical protein